MRYADDTVLIADTEKKTFVKVVKESEKQGLIINCEKNENIVVSKMNSSRYELLIADVEINTEWRILHQNPNKHSSAKIYLTKSKHSF